MNIGAKITDLEQATSFPPGSAVPVEMGDGTGTKKATYEQMVRSVKEGLPLGDLAALETEAREDLVSAINEVDAKTVNPMFVGCSSAEDGRPGMVPAPKAGEEDKVLSASGKWVKQSGGGGGGGSTIHVTTEDPGLYGKTVTATNGTVTMTGKFDFTGLCDIVNVTMNGNVTVSCTNDEGETAEQEIVITYYMTYNVELDARRPSSYINLTTTETTLFGKSVTASNGTESATADIGLDGTARIKVPFSGTVAVTASDGTNTASASVAIAADPPAEYSVTLQLYHLTVTTAETKLAGKTVTLRNAAGTATRTATFASGVAAFLFDANFTGACTVSASDGTTTTSTTVTVVAGTYSYSAALTLSVTYTAVLDFSKSAPDGIVTTYEDDAAGMTKGFAAWKDKEIYKYLREHQCILKDGAVEYYLNPDNIAKKADGSAADITTLGNDVMMEVPTLGYKIEWADSGKTKLKVSVTNDPNKAGFEYDAFSLDSYNDCDKIYIGVFKAHASGNKLYSSSGKAVANNQTITTFRTWARARGAGYQQRTNGSLKLLQCLYIIMHGTLNSQGAVGMGLVSASAGVVTGGTNAYGFNSEIIKASTPSYMTDGKHQVKCLGLEDFWGNYFEFIDGLTTDANRNVMTCRCAKDFVTEGTGYTNNGNGGVTSDSGDYMKMPQGGNGAGFTFRQGAGSDSTYFCDYAFLCRSRLAVFGGYWNSGSNAGAFPLNVSNSFSYAYSNIGARLMYMHKKTA